MKKILSVLLIASMAFMLFACNGGSNTSSNNSGNKIIISLQTNPTTGFDWVYDFTNKDANAAQIEFVEAKEEMNSEEGLVGAPIIRHYTFAAKKSGEQELVFTYKRNWEGGEVAYSLIYKLSVDDNLKIKVIDEKFDRDVQGNAMKHSYTFE